MGLPHLPSSHLLRPLRPGPKPETTSALRNLRNPEPATSDPETRKRPTAFQSQHSKPGSPYEANSLNKKQTGLKTTSKHKQQGPPGLDSIHLPGMHAYAYAYGYVCIYIYYIRIDINPVNPNTTRTRSRALCSFSVDSTHLQTSSYWIPDGVLFSLFFVWLL